MHRSGFFLSHARTSPASVTVLFDYLIRFRQHVRWDSETDLLGCLEINHQLEFGWSLYRQIPRLRSFKDLIHVLGGAAVRFECFWRIRHETTSFYEITPVAD